MGRVGRVAVAFTVWGFLAFFLSPGATAKKDRSPEKYKFEGRDLRREKSGSVVDGHISVF